MSTLHPNDELLATYTANELSPEERTAFETHLAACPICAQALQQTQSLRTLLHTLSPMPVAEPAPALAADVLARLRIANDLGTTSSAVEPGSNQSIVHSPEGTARPVSSMPGVISAASQSDVPREPSIQPTGYGAAHGGSFRRNPMRKRRTRDIDIPDDALPAFLETTGGPSHPHPRPPAHTRNSRPFLAVAAVLMLALLSYALFGVLGPHMPHGPASGAHATATSIKPTATPVHMPGMVIDPHTGLPADLNDTSFVQVQALGSNDLWGLGYFWQTPPSQGRPGVSYTFFGHFDGQKWTIWPVPLANVALNSFSMASDTAGWAVGSLNSLDFEHGVLVHFSNGAITVTQVPGVGQLFGVQMLSATQGWAVGNAPTDGSKPASALSPVTLHYVNGAWSLVPNTLYPEGITGLSMDSQDHGWITTYFGHLGYLANSRWVQWHQGFAADLHSVSSFAPNDAWAVGDTAGSPTSEPSPVVLHFDGHSWVPVTIPALRQSAGAMLNQVTMVSPTDGWMTGFLLAPLSSSQPQGQTPILLHYDGSHWQPAAAPANIEFSWISMSSSSDGWAMGWNPPTGSHTYLCHYQHGVWSVVTQFG